jgi:DNA repair exonuclease SbcCD nuclease subunit
MRILITGDKHLGLVSDGESRLEEQRRVLSFCIGLLWERKIDVYVDLGDLFHGPRPGPEAYDVAFDYLRGVSGWLAEGADPDRRAFLLAGNHDKPTRGVVNALTPLVGFKQLPEVVLYPRMLEMGDVTLAMLPFVTEWEARAEGFESAQAWLDDGAEKLSKRTDGRQILAFSHLEVPGAVIHEWDRTQRDVGLHVPDALLRNSSLIRVYAGHVHRYQVLERVTVVGSSIFVDFGEAADEKGAVIAEV